MAALFLSVCASWALFSWSDGEFLLGRLVPALVGVSLAAAVLWRFLLRQGMTVDRAGVTLHRGAFIRRVPWSEVRAVRVHRGPLASASLQIHRQEGRRLRPLFPRHHVFGPDGHFDAKAEAVLARHAAARAGKA